MTVYPFNIHICNYKNLPKLHSHGELTWLSRISKSKESECLCHHEHVSVDIYLNIYFKYNRHFKELNKPGNLWILFLFCFCVLTVSPWSTDWPRALCVANTGLKLEISHLAEYWDYRCKPCMKYYLGLHPQPQECATNTVPLGHTQPQFST